MITRRLLSELPFALPLYLLRLKIGPLPTTALELYLLILFAAFLNEYRLIGLREAWCALERFRWPVFAWVATTLLAVFIAQNPIAGLGLWRAYVLEPVLVFSLLRLVLPSPSLLIRNLFCVVIGVTIWAVIQYVTGYGIPHPWNVPIELGRRATGPFPYPNALALFVAPIGAYALSQKHTLGIVTIVAAFLSVLLARSEGGLIALGSATWIFLVLQPRFRRLILTFTVLAAILVAIIPVIHKPIVRELTFQGWSGKVRIYMWRDTITMLKDHWFLGAGFGGYPTVFKPYQRTHGIEVFQYPHNLVLTLWSETGLLGLLAFIWILIIWFRVGRMSIITALPLLTILIQGLVDVPYFKNDLAILFWMLVWLTTTRTQKPMG